MPDPSAVGDSTDEIEAVDFYTRPGCPFSGPLSRAMKRWGIPMVRYDIWTDEAAADRVRAAANGNETVPTIGIGTVMLVNPHLGEVVEALKVAAPNLVPDGPPPSLWQRVTGPFRRG